MPFLILIAIVGIVNNFTFEKSSTASTVKGTFCPNRVIENFLNPSPPFVDFKKEAGSRNTIVPLSFKYLSTATYVTAIPKSS
jgi:hypothetical protein